MKTAVVNAHGPAVGTSLDPKMYVEANARGITLRTPEDVAAMRTLLRVQGKLATHARRISVMQREVESLSKTERELLKLLDAIS